MLDIATEVRNSDFEGYENNHNDNNEIYLSKSIDIQEDVKDENTGAILETKTITIYPNFDECKRIYNGKYPDNQLDENFAYTDFQKLKFSFSFAAGEGNQSIGRSSSTLGYGNKTYGKYSTAIGMYNIISGDVSFAAGTGHNITQDYLAVFGKYAKEEPDALLIVGYGGTDTNRKNVFTVDKNGVVRTKYVYANNLDNYLYTFDTYRAVENFIADHSGITVSCYQRSMKIVSQGNNPVFKHNFQCPLDGTKYPLIKVRYKIEGTASSDGLLYFLTETQTTIGDKNRAGFAISPDGEWHDVIIDMSQIDVWDNTVKQIRFDIPNTSTENTVAYFKYIGLFHDMDEAESFELT